MGTVKLGDATLQLNANTGPIIFFEMAPNFGHVVGVIDIALVTTRATSGDDGKVVRQAEVVANLRCTRQGALDLKSALEGALLMLEPVENPEGKAN